MGIWANPYFLQDWFIPETMNLGVIYGNNRLPREDRVFLNRNCSEISYTSGHNFILTFLNEEETAGIPPWFVSRGMDFTSDKATWVSALKDTGAFTVYESWVARKGSFEGSSVPIALICPVVYGVWTEDPTIQIYATFMPDGKGVYSFSIEWNNKEIINDPVERYEATKDTSIWAKLPHTEKYACAFSSNLLYINKLSVGTFDPRTWNGDKKSKEILKDSWNITSREDLLEALETLTSGGQAGSFKELHSLIAAHPGKSLMGIACEQGLSILETNRLFFVNTMAQRLGSHGLSAWDDGRCLNLIRWSLAADYIDHNEAVELALPFVEKIESSYSSWEDFISHYIIGRGFFGLEENTYGTLQKEALSAALGVDEFMCVNTIYMKGSATNKNPVLSFLDAIYFPSQQAIDWESVVALASKDEYEEEDSTIAATLLEKNPDHAGIALLNLEILMQRNQYQKAVTFQQEYEARIQGLPSSSSVLKYFRLYQMTLALYANDLDSVLQTYRKLPVELQQQGDFLFLCGLAYVQRMSASADEGANRVYAQTAFSYFSKADGAGFELPEDIKNWMWQVREGL